MINYYLIMRGINLNTFIMLPIFALLAIKSINLAIKNSNTWFIKTMNVFLVYCLSTIVFYAINDAPISCYTNDIRQFVFPILFAYLGCCCEDDKEFKKWYLVACAGCFLIGLYLYIAAPGYYTAYLHDARSNLWFKDDSQYVNESNIIEFSRFSSFFASSYIISFFSIPALIISLGYSIKDDSPVPHHWCYVIATVSFIAAILCQQRIAIGFAFLVVVFFLIFTRRMSGIKKGSRTWLFYIIVILLVVGLADFVANFDWYDRIAVLVGGRLEVMNFSQALSERTGQYSSFDRATGLSYILGLGLGSCGHAAGAVGLKAIHDGEFVKLFYEYGLVGCTILAVLLISTLKRGLMNFKNYYTELLIIVFFLVAGLGSDSLTFFVYSAMFWFSVGRIWNINIKEEQNTDLIK